MLSNDYLITEKNNPNWLKFSSDGNSVKNLLLVTTTVLLGVHGDRRVTFSLLCFQFGRCTQDYLDLDALQQTIDARRDDGSTEDEFGQAAAYAAQKALDKEAVAVSLHINSHKHFNIIRLL